MMASIPGRQIRRSGALLAGLLACLAVMIAEARQSLPGPVPGWRERPLAGHTRYVLEAEQDCIRASSQASASALVRRMPEGEQQGDLLRWQWRAEAPLLPAVAAPERRRAGDDFLARVMVRHDGRWFRPTRELQYVWSREHPVGTVWPSPHSRHTMLVVVQSGDDGLGAWQAFERNVRADFRRWHDLDISTVSAIAIMTDTDNTGGEASACYRLPRFVALP